MIIVSNETKQNNLLICRLVWDNRTIPVRMQDPKQLVLKITVLQQSVKFHFWLAIFLMEQRVVYYK
jgi:hypothetical protein